MVFRVYPALTINCAGMINGDGFLHLPRALTAAQIQQFRQLREAAVRNWCYVHGTTERPLVVGDLLERYPRALLPVVTHARLLDLTEEIMGPFVQLDSLILFGAPPDPHRRHGEPVCWHRDRFGSFPNGAYMRPLTLICFAYLQPMTTEAGPLRVIPGSHRDPIAIHPDEVAAPHSDELLVATEPGDLVLIHHNLLHSGTHNLTDQERQFLGISYTLTCLHARDDTTTGPNCRALVATAHHTQDRRLLDPRSGPSRIR